MQTNVGSTDTPVCYVIAAIAVVAALPVGGAVPPDSVIPPALADRIRAVLGDGR